LVIREIEIMKLAFDSSGEESGKGGKKKAK